MWLLPSGINPNVITEGWQKFLRQLYQQIYCYIKLKGTMTVQNERGPLDLHSTDRKHTWENYSAATTCYIPWKRMTQRKEPRTQRAKPRTQKNYSQALRSNQRAQISKSLWTNDFIVPLTFSLRIRKFIL